ncbi:hypothetical protein K458DRAFT_324950 [Lentithecium fluviatile CBS 122367]|uniref:F-box domain-containing protein n=1 Tax=Lentithecium fluviatile CBS 122367 TaxID=1168545 RepID=A0A6G1JLU1_9PLEO|nr:hypothetical protein K458DRAFT_324950 [Lentithecium fluviatile CBS 122367]
MARSLLDLPPELLVHTLTFLPIQALLRFGQTCRHSHSLATSSLHTLSLGIHTTRISGIINKLAATQYPQPKAINSVFALPAPSSPRPSSASDNSSRRSNRSSQECDLFDDSDADPHRVSVLIPDAQIYDYTTLLAFHTALIKSILLRHSSTLRHLDLSLWTFTVPIAKAVASLYALRTLSIRIEDSLHVRAVPRRQLASQRIEQKEAWEILTKTAVWAPRLKALRIEGGELSVADLSRLLNKSRWCHEVWLCKCPSLRKELWSWLGGEWEGRSALRVLGVMRCGGEIGEKALDMIGELKGLRFLNLQECYGVGTDVVEQRNKQEWRIQEVIPPLPKIQEQDASMVLEVDPDYMAHED